MCFMSVTVIEAIVMTWIICVSMNTRITFKVVIDTSFKSRIIMVAKERDINHGGLLLL